MPRHHHHEAHQRRGSLQTSSTSLGLVSNTQHLDVNLVTKEGDTVTLSLDSRSAALYASMTQQSAERQEGHARYASDTTELSMGLYEREMTFTVEGDLNEEELRDVQKVLKTIDRMMNRFVEGRLIPMQAQAARLQGLDTIAGIEANMSYERQAIVIQQKQISATYDQTGGLPDATRAVVSDTVAPDQTAAEDDLVADMAGEIQAVPTAAETIMQFVDQLLADYRSQMEALNAFSARLIDRVHEHLTDLLNEAADPSLDGQPTDEQSTIQDVDSSDQPE
jgi:hypothetical protein